MNMKTAHKFSVVLQQQRITHQGTLALNLSDINNLYSTKERSSCKVKIPIALLHQYINMLVYNIIVLPSAGGVQRLTSTVQRPC
jgi:hypothetical protein